jgi:hypothetical protein
MGPLVIKTNFLHHTRLYVETVEAMILFGQRSIVDSPIEELKVGPHSYVDNLFSLSRTGRRSK